MIEPTNEVLKSNENDDFYNSDESEKPCGERWAPVGANDGDEFKDEFKEVFKDDFKYYHSMENLPYELERLRILEEEQETLNSSLIALTTHFAQVQFRLRQIVDAPAEKKESLLKELEEFAFRGIPDVPNRQKISSSRSSTPFSDRQSNSGELKDDELESKMALQRTKQKELISQLKTQLEDLEKYAYETGDADLPQSVVLERQNIVISHLKEKLNFDVDDLCKLPLDDLRWQVDCAISQIVSPLKMKEQLVGQLKTQIADLERFINYLQGEVSSETLACTCACPVHTHGTTAASSSSASSFSKHSSFHKKPISNEKQTESLNTVRKVLMLLHMYVLSQLGCSSERAKRNFKKKNVCSWRDLRTRLDIAVENILECLAENVHHRHHEDFTNDVEYSSDSDSPVSQQNNTKITSAVRKYLAIAVRDLMQHGSSVDVHVNSVVPFVGCFPQRSQNSTSSSMHAWLIVLKYYEIKNGQRYNSAPAQKLSQSFNLDLVGNRPASSKQNLLVTIGNIIASHTPYKRSYDTHFKAFICASLNANKLVVWLKLILQCQYLLENHYMSWSYVIKTGFQDAFHTLDRLTNHKFDLPVDLAIKQFQNIKDAF
ncbi:RUN domain-containing protein 1-like [Leptopilina heterotoma]|uniref:RUN domain-containing protein 1-like n=1 Tax=Leptopilina heterotoma TaxID=63436 RepID=UPI001CA7EA1D|nr:RUN domain-containing protein 1-like [Leptopilina heterotoma]